MKENLTKENFSYEMPNALDFEEVIIGTILVSYSYLDNIFDVLKEDYFYKPLHFEIFKTAKKLYDKKETIDILSIHNEFDKNNLLNKLGGSYAISELTSKSTYDEMKLDYCCNVITEKFIKRCMITEYNKIILKCYNSNNESEEILFQLDKINSNLKDKISYEEEKDTIKILEESIDKIEKSCMLNKEGKVTGIPTPFSELNYITSGFQKSDLIILAARPGMGKTAFCMNLIYSMNLDNYKADIYSLEMSSSQLMDRLISLSSNTNLAKIRRGTLDDDDWNNINSNIRNITNNILIDDTAGISINKLSIKARKRKKERNTDIIIIDYMQLMSGDNNYKGNRESEISDISRGLKKLAKELNVPIIALSQLSRAVESRGGNKKPQLSDLRESGAIEQDADIVMFLYRPEYYKFYEDETGTSLRGMAEVIIAKHRNGPLDTIKLKFIKQNASFIDPNDLEDEDETQKELF